ncbi:nitroreductase [Marinobacter sp.]|uniref:nitroreductase family protein n=1 Tax=Marinobacter sp. TaxID=50741 RepID=UPI00385126C0
MTDLINAILNRASQPRLTSPGPGRELLNQALACAARAPDHALLRPWRFLVIEGEGLDALGEVFASAVDDPREPLDADREKLRSMPRRAPMIIVGICSPKAHPKVPEVEQVMSAAAGLGYLLLALESAGFGAMWRTGSVAHHPAVREGLGLDAGERIAGFIYVGSVTTPKPAVPRPRPDELVSNWPA